MKQRSAARPDIEIGKNPLQRVERQTAMASGIHPKDLKSYKDLKFVYKEYQVRRFLDREPLKL
jgi:hypothetical protein